MGPQSRELLSRLTRADLADEASRSATSREIDLGYATVRATRITYVGELGWELYVPTEFAVGVYDDLLAAGADLGVANGGYYAIDSLRLEKGYRAFGRELTPDYTPVEAGLLFACKLRPTSTSSAATAVEQAEAAGPRRKLVSFVGRRSRADAVGRRAGAPRRRARRARSPRPPGARPWVPRWASPTSGTPVVHRSTPPGCELRRTRWTSAGTASSDLSLAAPAGRPRGAADQGLKPMANGAGGDRRRCSWRRIGDSNP